MDRIFLDANVLFSAAYAPENLFLSLWRKQSIQLLTSDYAAQEAMRNLGDDQCRERLERLLEKMEVLPVSAADLQSETPVIVELPQKDRPIVVAAVNARATHLLTGDRRHFGKYFGQRIHGVLIQTPAQYFASVNPGQFDSSERLGKPKTTEGANRGVS